MCNILEIDMNKKHAVKLLQFNDIRLFVGFEKRRKVCVCVCCHLRLMIK